MYKHKQQEKWRIELQMVQYVYIKTRSNAESLRRTTRAVRSSFTWSAGVHIANCVRARVAAQDAIACELCSKCDLHAHGYTRKVGVAFQLTCASNVTACSDTCTVAVDRSTYPSAMVYSKIKQQRILQLSCKLICYLYAAFCLLYS